VTDLRAPALATTDLRVSRTDPAPTVVESPPPRRRPRLSVGHVVSGIALAVLAIVFLYPMAWLVLASLKPRPEVFDQALVGSEVRWSNYTDVLSAVPIGLWVINSVIVGVAAALAVTVSSALVAYAFARFDFPGKRVLWVLVLGTMLLPGAVTLVPTYLEWKAVGLVDTQVPLWAGNLFGSAFYVFLLRQFFRTLPRDVFEAARVDGASHWRTFRSIAVPLAWPALVLTFVLELRASWTDLVRPLVFLQNPDLFTLPRGLKAVLDQYGQGGEAEWQLVLAASVIATVPMVVVFLLAQRQFTEGVSTTGGK
jgi:multiple sugar transport system permease protein